MLLLVSKIFKAENSLPGLILLKMISRCFDGVKSKLRLSHGSQLLLQQLSPRGFNKTAAVLPFELQPHRLRLCHFISVLQAAQWVTSFRNVSTNIVHT